MSKKILISGFEPFGSHPLNPTKEIITKHTFPGFVDTVLLPVTYSNSFLILEEKIKNENPDIVIMMGLGSICTEIQLEKIGINYINRDVVDNENVIPTTQFISSCGPDGIISKFDTYKLSRKLKVGESLSAGNYVCNYIYYNCLHKYPDIKSLFIHFPNTNNINSYLSFIDELIDLIKT